MSHKVRQWTTPRDKDLRLSRIENGVGLSVSALPNCCIFSIEHRVGAVLVNQLLGSPLDGGVQRIYLRIEDELPVEIVGPGVDVLFAAGFDCFVWEGRHLACAIASRSCFSPTTPPGSGVSTSKTAAARAGWMRSSFRISASATVVS